MLLLNVIVRLWWQPKETGTFPLPQTQHPRRASADIPGILSPSCTPVFASHWQRAGRLHWGSCSCCSSAVLLAVPGINLFSRLAPSPGKWLSAGGWCGRRGLLASLPCWQKETQSSAGKQHNQLCFPALALLTALCLSQCCAGSSEKRIFFFWRIKGVND